MRVVYLILGLVLFVIALLCLAAPAFISTECVTNPATSSLTGLPLCSDVETELTALGILGVILFNVAFIVALMGISDWYEF
jgi:hypothetical protein